MIPFKYKKYYNKDMKGSYSIKYVLPALFPNEPSLNLILDDITSTLLLLITVTIYLFIYLF